MLKQAADLAEAFEWPRVGKIKAARMPISRSRTSSSMSEKALVPLP